MQPLTARVQVIGFGPAAIGIAVAADRLGALDLLLDAGIVFLERSPTRACTQSARFPWKIESNSLASDFVESIDGAGAFAAVLSSPVVKPFHAAPGAPVWLPHVGSLMNALGDELERRCARSKAVSGVRYGTTVASVRQGGDGRYTSYDAAGRPLVRSDYVIAANGAEECRATGSPEHGPPTIRSGDVLQGQLDVVGDCLARGLRARIAGGSHSAFSVAQVLLDGFGRRVESGQIEVACRTPPAVYYESLASARASGEPESRLEVSAESGEVNRFHGLRGRARELLLSIRSGKERRVRLLDTGSRQLVTGREESAPGVVISAVGYAPRTIQFVAATGTAPSSPSSARVPALPGVFGIGIGYPRLDPSGRPAVGINLFHGSDSDEIVRALLEGKNTRDRDEQARAPLWS